MALSRNYDGSFNRSVRLRFRDKAHFWAKRSPKHLQVPLVARGKTDWAELQSQIFVGIQLLRSFLTMKAKICGSQTDDRYSMVNAV